MPKGWCPEYFYHNPNLENEKTLEQIWTEIQYYSGEFFPDDSIHFKLQTDFMVPLPPLLYEGKFVKGMFLSEGVDYIHSMFPRINELFISMAYTMWSSIPYSEKAEVYLTCYDYPEDQAYALREFFISKRIEDEAAKHQENMKEADIVVDIVNLVDIATDLMDDFLGKHEEANDRIAEIMMRHVPGLQAELNMRRERMEDKK